MVRRVLPFVVLIILGATRAWAQAPTTGTLRVTVVDPSSAVVVGATVSAIALDRAGDAPAIAPARTAADGIATLPNLVPGRYTVEAEFPGFETRVLHRRACAAGDNKQVTMLPIPKMEDVGHGRSRQAGVGRGSADRRSARR